MKEIARIEFTAKNGNTVRFALSPDGDFKVAALKGKHFQSTSELSAEDKAALKAWLIHNA
jgi:hypothetical protein